MLWRVILLGFLCLSCLVLTPSAHVQKTIIQSDDPEYRAALAAVNRFLEAWQAADHETGIMMLTDSARRHASRDRLQEFFSSKSQAAFEIHHGKRLTEGQYVFPVVLFGRSDSPARPRASKILITKLADEWAVDTLPR